MKNIEGQTTVPQLVVGWKVWYDDGKRYYGTTREDWESLPDDGVQCVMLYYNRFSTDGRERYRMILSSADHYFLAEGNQDYIYAHNNDTIEIIKSRFKSPSIKKGRWTDQATFRRIQDAAMADFNMTELAIDPESNTLDT